MTMQSRTISRYGFIDCIRGLAACLVMLQHSLYQSGLLGDWPSMKLTGFIPNWLELGETGVVAFFLVSGFVIPLSLERTSDFRLFWLHRVLRIYPLYITMFVVTFTVSPHRGIDSVGHFLVIAVSHLFFVQEYLGQENFVGGSWTLSIEMVWYIAISGLFLVSLNKRIYHIVAVSVALSLLAQISCATGHHLPMGRLSMLVCCVVGLVCYRREQSEISRQNFVGLLAVLALTIFFNILVGFALFPNAGATTPFRTVIDSWALAAVIFFVPFVTRRIPVWGHAGFSFLGRISYSVYLLHPVVLYLLSLVPLDGIGLVCATFAITITGSVLTYKFIEAPAIRFGHSLKARGPAHAAPRNRKGGDAQSRAVSKLRLAETDAVVRRRPSET